MAKKMRTPEERSIDPAAQAMLIRADEIGVGTAFSRADKMSPCNIGSAGMCCKICGMGPCRLTKEGDTGVCGATIDTIQARNLIRAISAGAAAHSDHGRDMAFTLKAVANGQTEGYRIRDIAKLRVVAQRYDIEIEGRAPEEIADELADLYISQFGQQNGELVVTRNAPPKRSRPKTSINNPVSTASKSKASLALGWPRATSGTVAIITAIALVAWMLIETELVKNAPDNPPTI